MGMSIEVGIRHIHLITIRNYGNKRRRNSIETGALYRDDWKSLELTISVQQPPHRPRDSQTSFLSYDNFQESLPQPQTERFTLTLGYLFQRQVIQGNPKGDRGLTWTLPAGEPSIAVLSRYPTTRMEKKRETNAESVALVTSCHQGDPRPFKTFDNYNFVVFSQKAFR